MIGNGAFALCYHAVSPGWNAPISVTPERFAEHLELLVGRGFRGLTFSDAVATPAAKRAVAITFDDGFRSVLEIAKPILDHYEMPATVFVTTGFVGSDQPMSWRGIDQWRNTPDARELLPMSWSELAELADAGWEVGSHTRSHPRLPELDDERLVEELRQSKQDCEVALGRRCRSLAYPYGDHDERVEAAVRNCGYGAGGTLLGAFLGAGEPLAASRIAIYHNDAGRRFQLKTSAALLRLRSSRAGRSLQQTRRQSRRARARKLNGASQPQRP